MKINSIINRYVFWEMLPTFGISLAFFSFIFLMAKIFDITNLIVNYRISITKVGLLLIYTMPYFLVFVIPMSVMMAVLMTFLRLSSDNEIIALKSAGVSLYRLLPPAIIFCLIGYMLASLMALYGSPWGRRSFEKLVFEVAASNLNVGLKERTFYDGFDGVILYTHKLDPKNNILRDVFIEDRRNNRVVSTIVSPKGQLFSDPGTFSYLLRLYGGHLNQVDIDQKTSNSLTFKTYDINLDLKSVMSTEQNNTKKKPREMYIDELWDYIKSIPEKNKRYYKAQIEFHNKFSIPFACIALGVLSVPLGVQSKSTRKSYGLGLGLIFFLLYYLLLSMGWVFGKSGTYPPVIGVWTPNVIMGGIGIFLLVRTGTENPVGVHGVKDVLRRAGIQVGSP